MDKKELIVEELKKELARRDYSEYCKYVHRGNWILGKHIKLICSEIENLIYRKTDKNILIVSLPPQHGKSQCISETLPSYYHGIFPDDRVIEVSYGDDLAQNFGRKNKEKILEFGHALFEIELDRASDTLYTVKDHRGSMLSKGIMAGITGNPGDLIIVDDPIKNRQEAESETYRNRIWEEFLNSIYTRLSAKGIIIVIMTRWHEDDLAGRILKNLPHKCKEINIPLEAEENDILGREIGDALFPEIGKDNAWLKDFKTVYTTEAGSRSWNALMQGRPSAADGNLFKREWWKKYTKAPRCPLNIMTVDATFKDTSKSDYVAIGVWGKRNNEYYKLGLLNKRMGFVETVGAIKEFKRKFPFVNAIYIEDKANGSAIIDVLRRQIQGVIPYNPGRDSKESRASAISPLVEAGQVYLPEYETWTNDFIDQCASFPNGSNDDMVDEMTMALNLLRNRVAKIEVKEDYDPVYGIPFESEYEEMLYNVTGGDINGEMFEW
ncbi:phage terminase large subunit [uncultured Clostridium sp.]|uniref:phage terminase large subunit n=1 Tax=uncultured Clostridium sp. TaxID=59620 RepID=UPI0025F7EEF6|nr:phage terminase large subunit [uncultured Clostridium sp.]